MQMTFHYFCSYKQMLRNLDLNDVIENNRKTHGYSKRAALITNLKNLHLVKKQG